MAPMRRFAVPLVVALAGCISFGVRQVGLGDCRDGIPHGSYTLQIVDGPVVATGHFVEGKKHGVFVFYSQGGTKIAEIPYAGGAKSGTVRMWYSEYAYPGAAGRPKLEIEFANDLADGRKQSWWVSGGKRSSEVLRDGSLVQAEMWDEAGAPLPRDEAAQLSNASLDADASYFRSLESEVDAHPPACARPAAPIEQPARAGRLGLMVAARFRDGEAISCNRMLGAPGRERLRLEL